MCEVTFRPGARTPPAKELVTYVMPMMCKMSNTSFLTAPIHTWSLAKGHASLFPPAGFNKVSAFLGQENNYFISSFNEVMH